MRVEHRFPLARDADDAFALLLDLERVAPCVPGAELGAELPDGSREVTVTVRLGPMRLTYAGTVSIGERDEAARRAVMVGQAREARGAGSASARIAMRVEPADGGSLVVTEADIDLTGRAAQMGAGLIQDVAGRMVADMAACLETRLAREAPAGDDDPGAGAPATSPAPGDPAGGSAHGTPDAAPPGSPAIDGGALLRGVLRDRLRDPRLRGAVVGVAATLLLRLLGRARARRRDA